MDKASAAPATVCDRDRKPETGLCNDCNDEAEGFVGGCLPVFGPRHFPSLNPCAIHLTIEECMKFQSLAALALGLYAAAPLLAAEIEDEVVITATRSPYSIDKVSQRVRVIPAAEIELSAARGVEDLLRSEGSLQVRDSVGNGRNVTLSLRGLGVAQNALVLLDGRRLNNSDLSEPDLTAIALQDVERIEVLEGGAGVLYGDQAVGGVINVITRRATDRGGFVAAGAGSYSARNVQFGYNGTALDDRLDYQLSGQRDTSEGYRDETEIDYARARAEVGWRYEGGRIFAEAQRTDNDHLLPGALLDSELEDDRRQAGSSFNDYHIDAMLYRTGIDHRFGDVARLLASYAHRDEDVRIDGRSLAYGDSFTEQARRVDIFDPRMVFDLGVWRLTVGSDLERYDYQLSVASSFGLSESEHNHERLSEYAQVIYSPVERLQLSAGIRHARVEVEVDGGWFQADYDDSLTVRQLGASWRLTDNLRLFVNRDETFRFPLAEENVDFMGSVVALKPQEGVAWELGGEWQLERADFGLVLFDHALEHEIGYDTALWANVNFDDTRRRGVTLDASWQPLPGLDVRASLTHMSAEFEAGPLDGNRVPGVSEKLAKLTLAYRFGDHVRLYAEGIYTGSMAVDMAGAADELGGYTVYNLAASWEWRHWLLRARLNNVTGKEYTELVTFFGTPAYYPSPRENVTVSAEYRF